MGLDLCTMQQRLIMLFLKFIHYLKATKQLTDTLRLGFTVDNLDEVIGRLKRLEGKIFKEPNMTEWGYVSIIEDIDGRKVELKDTKRVM
jgi:hypothetical protein